MARSKATPDIDLSPAEMLVLTKLVGKTVLASARGKLGPGLYPIDMAVRVTGSLSVESDTCKVPTVRIPQKRLMGLFLARSGALAEANLKLLQECVGDVIAESVAQDESEEDVGETCQLVAETLESRYARRYDEVVAGFLSGLVKTPVKGACSARVTVERLVTGDGPPKP